LRISRRRQEFWWSHHDDLVDSSIAHLVGMLGIGEELPGKHQSISVAGRDRVGTHLRIGCAAEEQQDTSPTAPPPAGDVDSRREAVLGHVNVLRACGENQLMFSSVRRISERSVCTPHRWA